MEGLEGLGGVALLEDVVAGQCLEVSEVHARAVSLLMDQGASLSSSP